MNRSTSRSTIVIARSPADLGPGEAAFVENALPAGPIRTFSSILEEPDLRAIDERAYASARSWFAPEPGADPTIVDGVSLGRAFELRATAILVLGLRAELVLRRLAADPGASSLALRSVGREWHDAAARLGLEIARSSGPAPDPGMAIPDTGRRQARMPTRILAGVVGRGAARADAIVHVEGASWARAHQRELSRRWPGAAVNPNAGLLVGALRRGRRMPTAFLADLRAVPVPLAPAAAVAGDLPGDLLRRSFEADAPALAASARLGRSFGGSVAVTTQDVGPTVRAFLLGFRAAGGGVVTLEHGISGWYAEQVHTVADVLAAWGPRQAEYHRAAGPPGVVVEAIGWPRLSEAVASGRRAREPRRDVVYFGQPSVALSAGSWPEDRLAAHRAVEAYARRRPGRQVGVKDHPAARAYRAPAPEHAAAVPVRGPSLDGIFDSRVVVQSASTSGLEAMALGRPVVAIMPRGSLGGPDFLAEGGAAIAVTSEDELDEALEWLLGDPREYARRVEAGRALAREFVTSLDDPAAAPARLVEIVERLRPAAPAQPERPRALDAPNGDG